MPWHYNFLPQKSILPLSFTALQMSGSWNDRRLIIWLTAQPLPLPSCICRSACHYVHKRVGDISRFLRCFLQQSDPALHYNWHVHRHECFQLYTNLWELKICSPDPLLCNNAGKNVTLCRIEDKLKLTACNYTNYCFSFWLFFYTKIFEINLIERYQTIHLFIYLFSKILMHKINSCHLRPYYLPGTVPGAFSHAFHSL